MSVMELFASRRTYRRFEQKAVPQDVVEDIIEALRLSSCGANRQAVRLVVVNRPEDVARVQPLVKWAAYLPPEQGTPKADELPTLYLSLIHISEPTRRTPISYAVFCLKKKNSKKKKHKHTSY